MEYSKETKELLSEYNKLFDDFPPLLWGMTYENKKIQEKIKEAIKKKKPLTIDDFEGIRSDKNIY